MLVSTRGKPPVPMVEFIENQTLVKTFLPSDLQRSVKKFRCDGLVFVEYQIEREMGNDKVSSTTSRQHRHVFGP